MKILYTPLMIVPSLSAEQRAGILEAAGPGTVLVEAKEPARQRAEIVDTDILFGRVAPDIFVLNRRLRFYHSIGAGVDAVLSPELVQSDIPLASEKGGVGIHLAEHAFALLLGLTRGLHTAIRRPDYGLREPIRLEQRELFESTMGIVGFGGTGREVARRALAFGMRVIGVDIEDVPPEPGVADIWKTDRLYEMLGLSDVVVIGLPLTKATRHLFTRDLFRRMRRDGHPHQRHPRRDHLRRGPARRPRRGADLGRRPRRHRSRAAGEGPSPLDAPARDRHAAHRGRLARAAPSA